MQIENARYLSTEIIVAMVDGVEMNIPAVAGNRHYDELLAQGIEVAAYVSEVTPTLSPAQWRFFLNVTGFGGVIDATLAAMPKTTMQERAAWAALEAVAYGSPSYSLSATIALAAQFGGQNAPSQSDIEEAWDMAAGFQGAASIMGA